MRFLLLPDDEAAFLAWARDEQGLELSMSVARASGLTGIERLAKFPIPLPGPRDPEVPSVPEEFLLRHPEWGVNDLEPLGESAVGRVMRHLNLEAAERAGVRVDDLINFEQTRVIRFRRCGWMRDGQLHVAALQGSARPARLQDPMVAGILKAAERWLVRGSVRVELAEDIRYRPRILARPRAYEWVLSGGVVYPWDG